MKLGVRKTKMNIFWLFMAGLLFGVIMGLRQPVGSSVDNRQAPVAVQVVPNNVAQ